MSRLAEAPPLAVFDTWEAVTSLGESAAETAVLLRAGLCNVSQSHFMDASGERIMVCRAPAIPPQFAGVDRLVALALQALVALARRCRQARRDDTDTDTNTDTAAPVFVLALSERLSGAQPGDELNSDGNAFVEKLRRHLPPPFDGALIEAFPFGRAAGAPALRRAVQHAQRGRLAIWGGVDTLHDWNVIEALERADRLLSADNVDGVRPGEGAAFLILARGSRGGGPAVMGVGTGREPCPTGSARPCASLGLTAALNGALAPLRRAGRRSNFWLFDSSHEAYATGELQNVVARFNDVIGLDANLEMPLKELGDVGAAAMPVLATLAAEAWRQGYANDSTAVVSGCSDSGARGAMLLVASAGR